MFCLGFLLIKTIGLTCGVVIGVIYRASSVLSVLFFIHHAAIQSKYLLILKQT